MIALERPLVFLDLETTGTAPAEDRIVDIALVKRNPDGSEESLCSLVDPGMPIPPESAAIHHITDEMVRGQPAFRQLAPRVSAFLGEADLAGFGIARFDIPMLSAEFKRAGQPFLMAGRRVIDALVIFHRMEPRNLAAAHKLYCGREHPEAHRAEPDARASEAVLWAMLERYGQLPRDVGALGEFCAQKDARSVDREGKFVWRNGRASFNFGKYRTVSLEEVARREPGYLEWLAGASGSTPELSRICREALAGRFPAKDGAA